MQSRCTHSEKRGERYENRGDVSSACLHFSFSFFWERYSEYISHSLLKSLWLYHSSIRNSPVRTPESGGQID